MILISTHTVLEEISTVFFKLSTILLLSWSSTKTLGHFDFEGPQKDMEIKFINIDKENKIELVC